MNPDATEIIKQRALFPSLAQFHVLLWCFFLFATSAVYAVDKTGETSYGSIDLYVAQILAFSALALIFSTMYVSMTRRVHAFVPSPVNWLAGYAAVAFITVPVSPNALFTFIKASQLLAVIMLAVVAGSVRCQVKIRPERLIDITYYVLIACMIIAWGVAIARPDLGTHIDIGKLQLGKIPFHYTTLGGMASVVAVAFFVRFIDRGSRADLIIFLFSVLTLAATKARLSTLYVVIAMFAVLFIYRRWAWLTAYFLAGASILIVGPVREAIIDFAYRQQSLETLMNLNGRVTAWIWGLERFWDHPVIGHGYYTGSRYLMPDGFTGLTLKQFHNDLLNILFNTGAAGLLCVAGVYVSAFISIRRLPRAQADRPRRIAVELGAVLSIIFATGLVHSSIGWDAWYMMFVFAAVAVTLANYGERPIRART